MLRIYNSFSQEKETFFPIKTSQVKIYVCGMTVYDYCHLGHMRMLVVFDVVVRYLQYLGYEVTYVRNITDIDDKIIKRAQENKESHSQLTERFIKAMHEDMQAFNLLAPHVEPRATSCIPQMISLIKDLLEQGYAYVASNGDVYFEVRSFPDYGCLSHRNLDELQSGARVEVNDVKKDPLDFVLWKMAKPQEPAWDSPWGAGRPGWHIECSAMAMEFLGEHFDLHGGGKDLLFPHHENEIAQAEASTHGKFVNFWLHNGYVEINNEKMAKSLGNFLTVRELLKKHSAEAIRCFIISSHYRSPLQYTEEAIPQAAQALERLYLALRHFPAHPMIEYSEFEKDFLLAMNDDFNTPVALSVLFNLAHEIQRLRNKDEVQAAQHAALLRYLGGTLGILQQDPEAFFHPKATLDTATIENLIAARNDARARKDWTKADEIRQQLNEYAIVLEDGPEGTSWRVSSVRDLL